MDPTARAHELIEVTESLTALIEQENELLQELRIKEIGALQQGKDLAFGPLRTPHARSYPGYRRIQCYRA